MLTHFYLVNRLVASSAICLLQEFDSHCHANNHFSSEIFHLFSFHFHRHFLNLPLNNSCSFLFLNLLLFLLSCFEFFQSVFSHNLSVNFVNIKQLLPHHIRYLAILVLFLSRRSRLLDLLLELVYSLVEILHLIRHLSCYRVKYVVYNLKCLPPC